MMTFGLNRPVFSFGLMVFSSFFAPGEGRCAAIVEDNRVMEAIELPIQEVEEIQNLEWFDPRFVKTYSYQIMIEPKANVARVFYDRLFEVTQIRVFEQDEDDVRLFAVAECEEDDI